MTQATATGCKSPLHQMTQTTPTCLWNDSASVSELTYSIEHGAVGATCNPVIVLGVLKKELPAYKTRIEALLKEFPTVDEETIAWKIVREISVRAAALLYPIYEAQLGKNGRLSIQTDPRLYRDPQAIVEQAEEFSHLAPNMIVSLDDWLKVLIEKDNIAIDPGYLEWAGVAVFKKIYKLFRERGYRIRLLSAVFLAGTLQAKRYRRGSAHRQARPPANRRGAKRQIPRFSSRLRRRRSHDSRIRHLRPHAPHASPIHHRVPRPRRHRARHHAAESRCPLIAVG